jgi:hypothetical protein
MDSSLDNHQVFTSSLEGKLGISFVSVGSVYCSKSTSNRPDLLLVWTNAHRRSSCQPLVTWFRLLQPLVHHFGYSFSLPWCFLYDSYQKNLEKKITRTLKFSDSQYIYHLQYPGLENHFSRLFLGYELSTNRYFENSQSLGILISQRLGNIPIFSLKRRFSFHLHQSFNRPITTMVGEEDRQRVAQENMTRLTGINRYNKLVQNGVGVWCPDIHLAWTPEPVMFLVVCKTIVVGVSRVRTNDQGCLTRPHVRRTSGCGVNSPHIPHVRWKKLKKKLSIFIPLSPLSTEKVPPVQN